MPKITRCLPGALVVDDAVARRSRFYGVAAGSPSGPIRCNMAGMPSLRLALPKALAWLLSALLAGPAAADDAGLVAIHAIQGRGGRSPLAGRHVRTEGAVTLVTSNGFFVQEFPATGRDARASRGLFVFTGAAPPVVAGQCVRLAGRVVEFNVGARANRETLSHTITELHDAGRPQVLREGCDVPPLPLALPLPAGEGLERLEGTLVALQGPLTVQQNFFLARFGQLTLAPGGRLQAPTNVLPPGAAAQALARANARRTIVLDDASAVQFPVPVPYLGDDGTVRAGDTVPGIIGVIDYGLATADAHGHGAWRIQPRGPVAFARANPRVAPPARVAGALRVAAANLDNYFSTPADGAHVCGPRRVAADCRGARNRAEFEGQRGRIVAMLAAIDADIVALMEVENGGATALHTLVEALNARVGGDAWAALDEEAPLQGADAVRIAMIYRPARVRAVGAPSADADPVHTRPPLAQTFARPDGSAAFNLVASHFKSRRCDGAKGGDRDRGDLQGCFSRRRTAQAHALARFAGAVARTSGVADTLLVGDFNAYAREDAPTLLARRGFADQVARFDPAGYSYVFDGAAGRLDGVFANVGMAARVTGVAAWHVAADEPAMLGYAFASRSPVAAPLAPWRASDHDPVIVDLRLPE